MRLRRLQPALGLERRGLGELAVLEGVDPRGDQEVGAGGGAVAGQFDVLQRGAADDGGDRLEAQGLAGEGVDVALQRLAVRAPCLVRFVLQALLRLWMQGQEMDHPGQGVGGGVLPGQQGGDGVGVDLLVGQADAVVVARDDEGLDQVAGLFRQVRVRRDARARLGDALFDEAAHRLQRPRQLAVGGQLQVLPVGERRVDAPRHHRKNVVQVLLDDVAFLLQGVAVEAEGEARHHVDGVAHQVVLHVHRLPGRGGPAFLQLQRDRRHVGEEGGDLVDVERLAPQPPLPLPALAFGGEHAAHAQLTEHRLEPAAAAEQARPVAQNLAHGGQVGDADDGLAAQAQLEHRTIFDCPAFQHLVDARQVDVGQVAE